MTTSPSLQSNKHRRSGSVDSSSSVEVITASLQASNIGDARKLPLPEGQIKSVPTTDHLGNLNNLPKMPVKTSTPPSAGHSSLQHQPQMAVLTLGRSKKDVDRDYHNEFLSGTSPAVVNGRTLARKEELRTSPLFSGRILDESDGTFKQYALIAEQVADETMADLLDAVSPEKNLKVKDDRVFLNVSTPWSAFICGSQGSGKSHTLSCMLENCLIPSRLGQLLHPLAGIVFHWDRFTSYGSKQICEAAYLCSLLPVKVLVSPTNYWRMKETYENLPGLPASKKPEVIPMKFHEGNLNVARMMNMMAVSDKNGLPLYVEVILRILREMAIASRGAPGLDYWAFKRKLEKEGLTDRQNGPLKLRLDLLESFMEVPPKPGSEPVKDRVPDFDETTKAGRRAKDEWFNSRKRKGQLLKKLATSWSFEPGTLTIVDLSCPFVDENAACALFIICLELFLENRGNTGRVVALDEAHKFLTGGASAATFTESLLQVIRQQRHLATRVIIATQEPTISPKLLDLSTITIVHRFTSPDWLKSLQSHLAGILSHAFEFLDEGNTEEAQQAAANDERRVLAKVFAQIVALEAGEGLLFSPSAMLKMVPSKHAYPAMAPEKLGTQYVKLRIRKRLTADGGRSIMAL